MSNTTHLGHPGSALGVPIPRSWGFSAHEVARMDSA